MRRTRSVLVTVHGALQRREQPPLCLTQDDAGERWGAAVLRQLAGAASYTDGDARVCPVSWRAICW
jgi:hypothetical protein